MNLEKFTEIVDSLASLPKDSALVVETINGEELTGVLRDKVTRERTIWGCCFTLREIPSGGLECGFDEDYDRHIYYEDISRIYLLEKREIYSDKK
jgi:hypothetical protein